MTNVICDCRKCGFWRNGLCTQSSLELSYSECVDYVDNPYTNSNDYQTEYFKAKSDSTNKWRERNRGKRIFINGEEFFTEDDDRNDDDFVRLTHARTGAYAGTIEYVKTHWAKTLEIASKFPDVTTLPLEGDDEDGQD